MDSLPGGHVQGLVDHLFRSAAGQMVSYLTRLLGPEHLELAEEVVQESLLKALQLWPHSGVPENPSGWLFQVARNAALDAVRRNRLLEEKAPQLISELQQGFTVPSPAENASTEQLRDDELRMLCLCCHPELSRDARVALSLKMVGGFGVGEIARAFLAAEPTIAQRLVRAKRQIREQRLSLELPEGAALAARLDAVLEAIYLIFNEGYTAHAGAELVRQDICREALRLAHLLADSPLATPQVHALVALIAFQAARLPARVDDSGELVLLDDQDRNLWDQKLIALGFRHFGLAAEGKELTAYHVQAAIASTHAQASTPQATDWAAILALYDQLYALNPSPVVALNRAVALAKLEGAAAALPAVESLARDPALANYYLLPAVRGHLLLELGHRTEAAHAFQEALALPCSEPERRFLRRKLAECELATRD